MDVSCAEIKSISTIKDSVTLIRVDHSFQSFFSHPRHSHPPLDLLYIQSGLREIGFDACLIDMWVSRQSIGQVLQTVLSTHPKFAIIKAYTWCIHVSLELGRLLRKKDVITIAVGQHVNHASVLWEENATFKNNWLQAFDFSIHGAPELECPRLIKKLFFKQPGKNSSAIIYQQFSTNHIVSLSQPEHLSYPQFTDKMMKAYAFPFPVASLRGIKKWAYVQTSWGCPYGCLHCSGAVRKSFGKTHYKRNPTQVIDEIIFHIQKGAQAICFEDDALFADKRHIQALCDAMMQQHINIPWMAHARPDELDETTLKKATHCGLKLLKIGVESGAKKQIEIIGKARSGKKWIEQVRHIFPILHHLNIASIAMFMIGTPGETSEDIKRSILLAREILPDYVQVQIFTPYPDTPYYQHLPQVDRKEINRMPSYHYHRCQWSAARMSKKNVSRYQIHFYRLFYLRTNYMLQFLKKNKDLFKQRSFLTDAFKSFINKRVKEIWRTR
ncbi:MAG: B12-binding domain-containing radical SAM protein [Candidatus Magnetomorum sp.]|nr:B12-binding domain-containing radical SAM protein [Candidatus Magnetomorum sp.]